MRRARARRRHSRGGSAFGVAALVLVLAAPAAATGMQVAREAAPDSAAGAADNAAALPASAQEGAAIEPDFRAPLVRAVSLAARRAPGAETQERAPNGALVEAQAPAAIDLLADTIAARAAALAPPATTRLSLHVEATSPRLAAAATQALARALRAQGFAPPHPAGDAASAEADAAIELRVGLRGDRLLAAGALRPQRANFFTGAALAVGGALAAETSADEVARLLVAPGEALAIELIPFARLERRPLALAIGALGGEPFVAALTEEAILLFDPRGRLRQELALPPPSLDVSPARDPRAGLVIAGDRLRYALPSRGRAGLLRREGDRLVEVRALEADLLPLAAAGEQVLAAALLPGSNLFAPTLLLASAASPAAPRAEDAGAPFVAALAAADGSLAVIDAAGAFRRLDGGAIGGRAIDGGANDGAAIDGGAIGGVGDAAALADLDGDGEAELIATARTPHPPDRVRVLAADGEERAAIGPLPHLFLAAAAGDLGAGVDEVVLGAADGSLHLLRRRP